MGRTWSTFQTPPRWGNLQNKPIWLSDNAANWGDILDKPETFIPSTHQHDAANITTGTFDINRIPTGTTPSSVALGNHNHAFNSLNGVSLTNPVNGEFLRFDGTNWINATATWAAIGNKPFGNNFQSGVNNTNRGITIWDDDGGGNPAIQLNRGKTGFIQAPVALVIDFAWSDDIDYNARIGMNNTAFYIDIPSATHRFIINGLPTSALGLPSGAIWRNGNQLMIN